MADDFAAFLNARYDEAEALAKSVARGPWHWEGGYPQRIGNAAAVLVAECYTSPDAPAQEAAYIAANDPAHRLADIALKRAILAEHEHVRAGGIDPGEPDFGCRTCHEDRDYGVIGFGWCATVRQLGTEFSGHADYKPEYRP